MSRKNSVSNTSLIFEELEPRLLLSADGLAVITESSVATFQNIVHSENEHTIIVQQHDEQVSTAVLDKVQSSRRTELVILDSRAPNFQQLHSDIIKAQQQGRDINVVILDAHRDGLEQITEALNKYNKLDAVHIVSHGSDSRLQLGATLLDRQSIQNRSEEIEAWKDVFADDGDLLIYGCNLADTQAGKSMVDTLSSLTATDVAASDDLTGNKLLGGDWDLEYEVGEVETQIAFSEDIQTQWQGSLASPVANNDSYSITEDQTLVINALNDNATSTDLIAAWQLDEGAGSTTFDTAGNGIDGTINGATWTPSSRTGDSALSFDGINDSVSLGSDPVIDDIFAGGGTITAWINPADWGGNNYGRILDKSVDTIASGGWSLQLNGNDGSLRFEHGFDGNNGGWQTDPGTISLGSWQHVAVVYDSSSAANDPQIYINGVLQTISEDRTPSGTADSDAAQDLAMGAFPISTIRNFDGVIDEVGIYNRDLTGAEISALFSTGIIANDTDSDGDALTASVVSGPTNGSLSMNPDGSFTYTPDADFYGADSFTYKVNDGVLDSNTATVDITVNPVNDAPVIDLDANDDSGQTGLDFITNFVDGDPPVSIVDSDVSLIDVDAVNLSSITVSLTNEQENGNKEILAANAGSTGLAVNFNSSTDVLTISGAGTVADYLAVLATVTYQNTQNNPDTTDRIITFVADDGTDTSLVATTTVKVFTSAPGNNIPVAQANTVSALEDNAYSFSAADFTFFDVDGDALVSATITNQALAGGTLTHSGGTAVTDGDTLTAAQLDTLIYTPLPDANGLPLATFDFAVNDSDPGTVFAQMDIDITPVNDVPVNTVPGAQVVDEDTALNISGISVSDVDADLDNIALSVSNGTLTVALQGSATISAGANSTNNLALSGSEADINATLASLTYQGNTDFYGAETLTVTTTDTSAASDTDTVSITVNPVNDAPVANNDNYSVAQDQTLTINALTDNATATDLEAAWLFDEGSGSMTDDATGNGNDAVINGASWTASGRTGNSALSFDGANDYVQASSSTLDLSTAMNFTLSAWFQTDTTTSQHHLLWQGVSTENGWGNPSDNTPTSSEMNLTVGRYDTNDKITFFMGYDVNDANSIDITSASNFTDTGGWHQAVVTVTDLGGGILQADLYIDGVLQGSDTGNQIDRTQWDSDLLIGQAGSGTRLFDGQIDEVGIYNRALTPAEIGALYTSGVLANDTDAEGDALSASIVAGPSNGSLSLNTDGSFTYTPNTGFAGADTFTYSVSDGALVSNTATVTIDVTNTAPVATDDPGEFNTTISSYNPVSYWQLGESGGGTAADAGSAGVSATLNGVTLGQSGAINGDTNTAISFDGVDDYVEIAHDNAYMLDDGSIQLWFNADDVSTQQGLISKDSSGFDNGGHFTISILADGSIEARLQSATSSYYVNSVPASVTAGDWHHVAVNFGAGGMELFLDGASVDTNAYTGGLGTTSGGTGNDEPIAIGASTMNSDDGSILRSPETAPRDLFAGKIDEVAIIGQALTAEQVQNLYASALQNYTVAEDLSLVVSAAEGVLINDSDAEGNALTAVLVSGPSNAASFTLNANGSFNYTPIANFSGTDTFTYMANDGNDDSNIATVTISITGDNDAPVNTVPGAPLTVPEDTQTAIAGVSVADPDAGGGIISTQLNVTSGILDVALSGAATISAGANSSNTLTISGNVTDINNTLASLQYTGNSDVNGTAADTLTVVTNDLGNTGTGGAKSDTDNVQIDITPVNDVPTVANLIPDQAATEDTPFSFQFAGNTFDDVDGDTLTYTSDAAGWLSFNAATRTFSGTPLNADVGTTTVTVTADDGNGGTVSDTFDIVIGNTNDAPTVANVIPDQVATEDTPFSFQFASNTFDDVDGDALTYTSDAAGWLSFNAGTRTFSGTPLNADVGTTTVTVTADDGNGGTVSDTFDIVISNTNDAPTVANAIPDQAATEDTPFSFQFAGNAFDDVDGDTLTYTSDASGWLSFNAGTRTFSGTPLNGDVGTTTVTVTADDGNGGTVSDTFDIVIGNTNDAPTVANVIPDQVATEDTPFSFQFASNAFDDVDGDTLTYTSDAAGWLSFNAVTRTFSGTPLNGDVGTTTVTVTADDGNGGTVSDTFDIVISNTNDAPTVANAIPDQAATEDSAFTFTFAVNTFDDVDGDTLTYTSDASGWLSFNAGTRTFSGTPLNGDVGTTTVTVTADDGNGGTVSDTFDIVIANTNDAPTVANSILDQAATEDSAFTFTFAANTFDDVDGDTLTYTSDASGWLSFNAGTRTFSGTPLNADVGTTTVMVTADDGNGGTVSDMFDIVIGNTNDAPTVANAIPDQSATEDSAFTFTFAANTFDDVDGDTLTYTSDASGWLSFNAGTRTFSGTPLNADVGTTTVTVTADDGNGGTVSETFDIVISNTNDAAIIGGTDTGSLTEDVDPDTDTLLETSGVLTITDDDVGESSFIAQTINGVYGDLSIDASGNWNYSADNTQSAIQNLSASDTLTDTISVTSFDGTTHNVVITIGGANDAPVAIDDNPAVDEGGTAIFDLAANDVDIDNAIDLNSISITGAPSNGSLVVNGNGTVTYTHDGSETVSDSFSYTIADVTGAISNIATVNITVNPLNDSPSAQDDTHSVDEGSTVVIDLSANDTDPDSPLDLSSIVIVAAPVNGTYVVNTNGTVDYTHDGSQTASDSFTYTISDISGAISNTATVNITVNPVNNAPTTIGIIDVTVSEDSAPTSIDLNAAFDDADNLDSELTYSITGNTTIALFSSATVDAATGELILDYAADQNGASQISIRATDPSGASVETLFTVTVSPVNDAPVLASNTGMTAVGTGSTAISTAELSVDDIDSTDSGITFTVTELPANGVLMLNGVAVTINSSFTETDIINGNVSYQSDGISESDQFTFTVSDSDGATLSNNVFNIVVDLAFIDPEVTNTPIEPEVLPDFEDDADPIVSAETESEIVYESELPDRQIEEWHVGGASTNPVQSPLTLEPRPPVVLEKADVDNIDYYDESIEQYKSAEINFSTVSTVADIQVKSIQALWAAIDEMKDQIDKKVTDDITEVEIRAAAVSSSGVALTAGVVAWVLRSGALMTSLISTIPLWKGYDPLPILTYKDDEDEEGDITEDKIPTSLDELKKIKSLKEKMNKYNQVDNLFEGPGAEG